MAVSNEEINAYLAANPGMNDAGIASAMDQFKVSPEQMAQATGFGLGDVQSRYNAATTPPQAAGITSLAPLYTGLTAQSKPEDIASAYSQFTQGAGGNTQANQTQAIDYLTGLGIAQPTITDAYKLYQNPVATQADANTAAPPVFDPSKGVFQTVYDPRTGQEFISPAQAFASGVTDYVTEMPMKLEFLNDTSKKAVTDAMTGGMTFDQALASLGGKFGMSGKDFYNYEVQGGIRSNNSMAARNAVSTESGGLKPDELVAKLQAYRDKPPTTAQELRDQQALYADYANRYANSSYDYANMGGKAQDYSLKPQEYLKTQFTGYSDPLNTLLSSMNQNTPTFSKVKEQITGNPEIEKALAELYAINPKAPIFTGGNSNLEATINNLAGNISQIGENAALKNFYKQQQNLIGFGGDNWFEGQNMGTPQYAELQRKQMSFTPVVEDMGKWEDMARRTSGSNNLKQITRDPNTNMGVGLIVDPDTGYHKGIGYYDRNGQLLRTSLLRPEDILKNAEKFGFDISGTGALGKVLDTAKVDVNPAEMATPEWLESQIKHLEWQASSAGAAGMPYSDMAKQSRIREIRQTHDMAKRMAASRKQTNMAQGGIVALAAGGVSDKDVQNWFAKNAGANDAQIAAAMQQFKVAPEQVARVTGIGMPEAQQRYETAITPQIVGQYTEGVAGPGATTATPGTGYLGIFNQLQNAGVTAEELYNNPNYKGWSKPDLEQAYNVAGKVLQFDPITDSGTPTDKSWVDFMDANKFSARSIAQATGLSEAEVQRRYAAAKKDTSVVQPPVVRPPVVQPPVVTTPTVIPGDITQGIGNLPGGVSGGGNTVLNPNGTVTTAPNIPGRPPGGFTGMGQVRDVYTERGGSLGYVNPAPKTMEEFNQRFNRQTGDSLAAYEYLMGKGANPIKSGAEQIMRPYSEAVMGIPAAEGRPTQKFIYQNGRYIENPNYRPLSYNSKGERMVGLTPAEVLTGLAPFKGATNDAGLFDFVAQNNISEAQLAAALGISIAEARARLAAGKKIKGVTTTAQGYDYGGGGGGDSGSAGASGDGSSGSSGTAGDAAAAAAADGAAADGPGTGAGWAYGGQIRRMALGGLGALAGGGSASQYNLGSYSDGGRLLRGPGDGVSDSIPATIGDKQPARLADGEFVVPARIVSELGNGSTEAGARKLYAMMDRVQKARGKTTGKNRVAANTRSEKYLPA